MILLRLIMETYYPIVYITIMFVFVVIIVFLAVRHTKFSNLETKLTGVWTNESRTVRIILHDIDSVFQAEIVWLGANITNSQLLGFKMVRDLMLKNFNLTGTYVDPSTGLEHPLRLWWLGKNRIKLDIMSQINGSLKLIKEETWVQV